jgi:hypothetical protein
MGVIFLPLLGVRKSLRLVKRVQPLVVTVTDSRDKGKDKDRGKDRGRDNEVEAEVVRLLVVPVRRST